MKIRLLLLLLAPLLLNAQTKMIEHKRNGGSVANFNAEDYPNSNFGVAPMPDVKISRLDSVIFVDKHTAIMVTSACLTYNVKYIDTSIWKPGRAVVKDHPLFKHQHKLNWIKKKLKSDYNFQNDIEKTVFIGFDNNNNCKKKIRKQGKISRQQSNSSKIDSEMIIALLAGGAFIGLVYYGNKIS